MEIILVILFVAIMVGVSLLKARIPRPILVPLSLFIGAAMLIWFWVFMDGELHWKILVSVVVLSGWYSTLKTSIKQA